MSTTIVPPAVAEPSAEPLRLLTISVNLLPDEVVGSRTSRAARRISVVVLVLAALATGGWYYLAMQKTSAAQDDLNSAQSQVTAAQQSQHKFDALTRTTGAISTKLAQVAAATTGDVAWGSLYPAMRTAVPTGVSLTGISGTAAVGQSATLAIDPNTAGGVVITGVAPSKPLISQFVTQLAGVSGIADPLVTSVAVSTDKSAGPGYQFSIQARVTDKAFSTRFSTKAPK